MLQPFTGNGDVLHKSEKLKRDVLTLNDQSITIDSDDTEETVEK
jgi:hypothetical protein